MKFSSLTDVTGFNTHYNIHCYITTSNVKKNKHFTTSLHSYLNFIMYVLKLNDLSAFVFIICNFRLNSCIFPETGCIQLFFYQYTNRGAKFQQQLSAIRVRALRNLYVIKVRATCNQSKSYQ